MIGALFTAIAAAAGATIAAYGFLFHGPGADIADSHPIYIHIPTLWPLALWIAAATIGVLRNSVRYPGRRNR